MQRRPIEWQPTDTVEEFAYRYHTKATADLKVRWQALWLLRRGQARVEVCDLLDINPRTLRDWIAWYRQGRVRKSPSIIAGGDRGLPRACRWSS